MKFILVYVTCPNVAVAKKIATHTVKNRLAACANILPQMHSVYSWKGKVESAREVVLILKTRATSFKKVEKAVLSLHPYECPCIVAIPITHSFSGYTAWLQAETR